MEVHVGLVLGPVQLVHLVAFKTNFWQASNVRLVIVHVVHVKDQKTKNACFVPMKKVKLLIQQIDV